MAGEMFRWPDFGVAFVRAGGGSGIHAGRRRRPYRRRPFAIGVSCIQDKPDPAYR